MNLLALKRISIFFTLIVLNICTFSQEAAQPLGSKNTAVKVLGRFYVDSLLAIPKKVHGTPLTSGVIGYDSILKKIKLWDGISWNEISGGSNSGLTGGNLGSGYSIYKPSSLGIKTLKFGNHGLNIDTISSNDEIDIAIDENYIATKDYVNTENNIQWVTIANHTSLLGDKVNKYDSFYNANNYTTRGTHSKDSSYLKGLINENTTSISTKLNISDTSALTRKLVLIVNYNSNYTLSITDANGWVRLNSSSPLTCTVPNNATVSFPLGTQITIRQAGTGQITFTQGAGVTLNSEFSALKTLTNGSTVYLLKVSTDEWDITGSLTN